MGDAPGQIGRPSKIICVGRNFADHVKELGNPMPEEIVFFLKPPSALSQEISWREGLEYEGELAFRIEKGAITHVAFGIDLTLRPLQRALKAKGLPWERAKAFRGSLVVSPFLPLQNWRDLELRLYRNETLVQQGGTWQMLYDPNLILAQAEEIFGLEDGDWILTGTPAGVGTIERQDRLRGEIWRQGRLILKYEWVVV
ncbi:MAG: 2-keto-4-pentenoate hydratase [Nitratiruptor sp.]|nr:2-keto-4-pentenoate hydratase [Nitratiruptor sp.]NPA83650.1 fumarylacetoacetate hydrolase family protein [Campylobacterota bacterium]